MSSIVTKILSSTVGLLLNKARDSTAAKLKNGDVTDAKIRQVILRELNDVKAKLDGLSRKDLLSSYNCLEVGIDLLNVCLDESMHEMNAVAEPSPEEGSETSTMPISVESGILNEALELSNAMGKLKIVPERQYERAKEQFKDARRRATDAFSNEALGIEDRLMAAKLRIVATILECLESPEAAIEECLSILKQLHGLRAIVAVFSVYLNRRVKSVLNKAERVEYVKSVMWINYVLFQLFSKFSKKNYSYLRWPVIELTDRCFQPILHWSEVSTRKSMREELSQYPNGLLLDREIFRFRSAMNCHGEIIVVEHDKEIKVISRTGESKVIKLPQCYGDCNIAALGVDSNNNVYVLRHIIGRFSRCYALRALDKDYNVIYDRTLNFIKIPYDDGMKIAINHNNDLIIIHASYPNVYVCDNAGQLLEEFKQDSCGSRSLSIINKNSIMLASDDKKAVYFYTGTDEGYLKSTMEAPEGHKVHGVVFHCVIGKIIVLTFMPKEDSYFLLCYSENGELETSTFLLKKRNPSLFPYLISHPSAGHVAVIGRKIITFI